MHLMPQETTMLVKHAKTSFTSVIAAAAGMALLAAGMVAVGALAAWRISRSVTGPLTQAVAISQSVAAGTLPERIEITSRDETGQLLRAFIAGLPKAELHVHHVGSATPAMVADLVARHPSPTRPRSPPRPRPRVPRMLGRVIGNRQRHRRKCSDKRGVDTVGHHRSAS